ncbi:MAG: 4-(cytidine 5'-diphospho)-2-C-methyl-D-erythritol kinase [Crocinitomicaceae bacterium]|nr:4-(cytidine 5'-diphospho)-2-C-methyl-D-erythritol kinase [Crocinitomicaceae bacterium]
MIFYPNCKINIGLDVLEKREDGFHNLKSVFYPIPLKDILEIVKSDDFNISFSGRKINGDFKDNLIYKAFELMQIQYGIGNISIHLHKQIPMGAGLGGGSADAAFALMGINEIYHLNLSNQELMKLASELGSDCPFFIFNTPCYVTGRGEIIEPIDMDLSNYWIKIIHPNINISTKEAFQGIHAKDQGFNLKSEIQYPVNQWSKIKNDFEETIFPRHSSIKDIKEDLIKQGAIYASMTGTGSSVYGLFSEQPKKTSNSFEFIHQL